MRDICEPDRVKQDSSGLVRHTCRLNRVPAAIVVVADNARGQRRVRHGWQEEKVQKLEVMQKLINVYSNIYIQRATSAARVVSSKQQTFSFARIHFLFTYTIENNEQRSSVNCAWCTHTQNENEDGIVLLFV